MKNTTKRILLVSTFMLTASHAANPVDSTNTPSTTAATVATAAVQAMPKYPQINDDYSTPLNKLHARIVGCLIEYDHVMLLESERKVIPNLGAQAATLADQVERLKAEVERLKAELSNITKRDTQLDTLIAEATAKLDAGRKYSYTKEETAARWAEQQKIKDMKEEKAQLKQSNSQRLGELKTTESDLKIALRSAPSKLVQMYRLLMKAATANTPSDWIALPKAIEEHNTNRSKEIAELNVKIKGFVADIASAEATLASDDATDDAKEKAKRFLPGDKVRKADLEKARNDKRALIVETAPAILNYLSQFSQLMSQQISVPGQEPKTLGEALGVWGQFDPKDSLVFRDPSVDAGNEMAKSAFKEAPFFGGNSLEFQGETGLEVPLAPTFEQVLAAMREFAHNPFGRKVEQATRGSESGPAAAVE